jgi:hypothetical protein
VRIAISAAGVRQFGSWWPELRLAPATRYVFVQQLEWCLERWVPQQRRLSRGDVPSWLGSVKASGSWAPTSKPRQDGRSLFLLKSRAACTHKLHNDRNKGIEDTERQTSAATKHLEEQCGLGSPKRWEKFPRHMGQAVDDKAIWAIGRTGLPPAQSKLGTRAWEILALALDWQHKNWAGLKACCDPPAVQIKRPWHCARFLWLPAHPAHCSQLASSFGSSGKLCSGIESCQLTTCACN